MGNNLQGGESGGDEEGNPLPTGQGGVIGGVVGTGGESPLLLPLLDERPPGSGMWTFPIGPLLHGRTLPHPIALPIPLLVISIGPLPALPLLLSFLKYAMAFNRACAHPPKKISLDLVVSQPSAILFR